jgi:hypothetical protein
MYVRLNSCKQKLKIKKVTVKVFLFKVSVKVTFLQNLIH